MISGQFGTSDPVITATGPCTVQQLDFIDSHQAIRDPSRLNTALRLRLRGDLELSLLAASISQMVERNEALRTHFRRVDDQWIQEVVALSPGLDSAIRASVTRPAYLANEVEVDEWCARRAGEPFRLDNAPLFRLETGRTGDGEWVVSLVQHHIITDAASTALLLREVVERYIALRAGVAPEIAPVCARPIEVACRQVRLRRESAFEPSLRYWERELDGARLDIPLPGDRPRPQTLSGRGHLIELVADAALLDRVHALAGELGVTPYSILLTTYGELLRGLTDRDEVVVGGTFANRVDEDTEMMIGHMANSTLFRLRGAPGHTIDEAIRGVARMLFMHADHQEVPYRLVAERLDLVRRSGVDRFPQSAFVLNSDHDRLPPFAGLDVRAERVSVPGNARADLVFVAVAQQSGLRLWAEFSADYLDPATVRGWIDCYLGLLCTAVDSPRLRVADWTPVPGPFVSA